MVKFFNKVIMFAIILSFFLQPFLYAKADFLCVNTSDFKYLYKKTDDNYTAVTSQEIVVLKEEINQLLKNFEDAVSVNVETSDTFKINNAKAYEKTKISDFVVQLFTQSKYYYDLTEGAFNIATYNLTKLWGFSPDNSGFYNISREEPSEQEILKAKALSDVDFIITENENFEYFGEKENYIILYNTQEPYIIKSNSEIKIDFGGIAKGYICDKAGEILENYGINSGALKILSNIYLLGGKVIEDDGIFSERNFTVSIENPRSTINSSTNCLVVENVTDRAITTSADNYRYYIYDNKIYPHIINAFTGKPVQNGIISVSVFTDNGTKADAFSTAGFVMGLTNAITFFQENNVNAVIITADYKYYVTGNLQVKGIDEDDLFTYAENGEASSVITNSDLEKEYLGLSDKKDNKNSIIISVTVILFSIVVVIFLIKKSEK